MKVGRIEYLSTKGTVGETVEYTDAVEMLKDVTEDNYYGVPMNIVIYSDENGPLIPVHTFSALDPAPCGFKVE